MPRIDFCIIWTKQKLQLLNSSFIQSPSFRYCSILALTVLSRVKPFCYLTRKGPLLEKISKHLSDLTGTGPFLKKQIMSSHKKRTVPSQTDCCVISQERNRPLKNKLSCHLTRKGLLLKQTKTPNKIVATDHKMRVDLWNLVTTCGMALRLEILIASVLYLPKRGQAVL